MKRYTTTNKIVLNGIFIGYLLLFFGALAFSADFLSKTVQQHPIPLIELLKYLLLCVLFLILIKNTLKAFTLKPAALSRLAASTVNFKWLFTLAVLLAVAAKLGLFSIAGQKAAEVNLLQIGILTLIAVFCFWGDKVLRKETASTGL